MGVESVVDRSRRRERGEGVPVPLLWHLFDVRRGIVELVRKRALVVLRISRADRGAQRLCEVIAPLREDCPALVIRNVVVTVALNARRWRIQFDGGDVVRALLEVIRSDDTG